ncbi:hypothetical protein CYMTET_14468, partial [Cymbomonas tetramitiformis]
MVASRKRPCAISINITGHEHKVSYSTCPICLFQLPKDCLQGHLDECAGDLDAPYSPNPDDEHATPRSSQLTPSLKFLAVEFPEGPDSPGLAPSPKRASCDLETSPLPTCGVIARSDADEIPHEYLSPGNEGGSQYIPSPTGSPISDPHRQDTFGEEALSPALKKAHSFPLYPIFKANTKTVYLIRHGESEYNAAASLGPSFDDPLIFDPHLTPKGRFQAKNLGPKIREAELPENTLFVTSPLTRAMETLLLGLKAAGLPLREKLKPPVDAPSFAGAGFLPGVQIHVEGQLTEHLATSGDIGRPRADLLREFPELSEQLTVLPEGWWFDPSKNSATDRRFIVEESKENLRRRTGNFRA